MKKGLMGLGGLLAVVVLGVAGMASTKPDTVHLERSVTVDALAQDVAPLANDLRLVNTWSPWLEKDPALSQSYSDATTGVGAWYAWSGNDEVGEGKMTVTEAVPGKVVHHLEFFAPWAGEADSDITWSEDGGSTTITWGFDQPADFGTKVMQVFMSFEDMLGADYDRGVANLKTLAEQAAKERVAAAEAALLAAAEAAAAATAEASAE